MISDGFGTLYLPTSPVDAVAAAPVWSSCLFNVILVLISILLFLINLKDYLGLMPTVFSCLFRARPNIVLEHNFHFAQERNTAAWILLLPFALIVDRYKLYCPSFIEALPLGWSLAAIFGVIAGFVAVRYLFFPFRPYSLHGDESKAVHLGLFTTFVAMVTIMLPTVGIMYLLHCGDDLIRNVLIIEIALFYLDSSIICCRILSMRCSALSTFLYLCALEILPAALIVGSELLL